MLFRSIRRQWEHAAATDYLTDLPNRRTLTESGEQRFVLARAQNSGLTVVVIDIDHFKNINDRYGHDTGDRALIHVAKVLRSACPATAQLARQGGEEFVVLFDTALPADAIASAERLRLALHSTPLALPSGPLTITASFGVSVLGSEDRRFDDTLRRADQAVYAAKSAGRNRVELDV